MVRPGDTVTIRQDDGFVTLFSFPGPAGMNDPKNPEVLRMEPSDIGLVVAIVEYDQGDCHWPEALVMVATGDGATRMGWRETDMFRVMREGS